MICLSAGLATAQDEPNFYNIEGPYPEDPASYYVYVKVNFLDGSAADLSTAWFASYDLEDEAAEALAVLNAGFNEHQIYFLPYGQASPCGPVAGAYGAYLGSIAHVRENVQSQTERDGALNIYIRGDSGFAQGQVVDGKLPSNQYLLYGIRDVDVLVSRTEVSVHEAGHCLGLYHTFSGNLVNGNAPEECLGEIAGGPISDFCSPEADPAAAICHCCGDYVCDTPPNQDKDIQLNSDCTSSPPLPVGAYNFMSYVTPGECRDHFTPEQGRRMRTYLREFQARHGLSLLNDLQQPTAVYPASTPANLSGNILVESGTLEITQELKMLPGAEIRVKPGATLRVRAKITGACGERWKGIIVEGQYYLPQSPISNQGRVLVLGGGQIENAECGIKAEPGAIVIVQGGSFRNNIVSADFDFDRYTFTNSNRFWLASFSVDDDYLGSRRPYFIKLNRTRGLYVNACTFTDERTECGLPTYGIHALESRFRCLASSFSNLTRGIYASALLAGSGAFSAYGGNTFYNCSRGIQADNCSSFRIEDNTFLFEAEEHSPCLGAGYFGVYIKGAAQGFTCEGNTFELKENVINETFNYYGTYADGTGQGLANAIAGNTYIGMRIGNAAKGNNGGTAGGLLYQCNYHSLTAPPGAQPPSTPTFRDYWVRSDASIASVQSSGTDQSGQPLPAGNIFSGIGLTIDNQNTATAIQYYYGANLGPQEDPDFGVSGANGVDAIQSDSEEDYCTEPVPCERPPCAEVPIELESFFMAQRQLRDSIAQLLPALSGQAKEEAALAMQFARRGMSSAASTALQYYAQDTVEVKEDSLLYWLELAETFEAGYEAARHHFFRDSLAAFDSAWQSLPSRVSLDTLETAAYQNLDGLFTLLRPQAQSGQWSALPPGALEGLAVYAAGCDEAAYLAANLLRRNGYESIQACAPSPALRGSRPAQAEAAPQARSLPDGLLAYPNPAKSELFVHLPEEAGTATAYLLNAQGQVVDQRSLAPGINTWPLSLPPGLYFLTLPLPDGQRYAQKIIVQ